MNSSDKIAFHQLLTGIGMMYNQSLHESVMDIWWRALDKVEFNAVRHALNTHVVHPDKGQFMPKPADVMEQLEGSRESQAMRAWALVSKTLREVGAYHSVIFRDALIHAVIRDMGGWIALCQSKLSELPFREREFEKRYQALMTHPPLDCPHQLTGLLEQQNRLGGYCPPDPIRIGERNPPLLEIV